MKKLTIIALLVTGFLSCTAFKQMSSTEKKELRKKYSVIHNVVYYEKKPFAELQAMTWSLDNGELVREMNFKLLDKQNFILVGGMIDFLSERHQGDEIEVEFEIERSSEEFAL